MNLKKLFIKLGVTILQSSELRQDEDIMETLFEHNYFYENLSHFVPKIKADTKIKLCKNSLIKGMEYEKEKIKQIDVLFFNDLKFMYLKVRYGCKK